MNPLQHVRFIALLASVLLAGPASAVDGNRLTYLDGEDPFHPHRDFPKLITPQWVGEPGVEAVVILAIDDMRDPARYEAFLRPILNRLKQIDGRAPVSIMANAITPTNAQLQAWLKEGVSLEVHTLAHPCPCLQKGDFNAGAGTYHGGVELLNQIPGSKPVAFRMPCCDSMNSASPRFYAGIFNHTNRAGQFLTIDSSVFCLLTTNDTSLPRGLVLDADGREKFRKYFPAETNALTKVSLKNYAGYIEDYPYPYVVGKLCWQFPCMVPSDWEAFNLHGATNPVTLADWKAALDAVVLKQGVFTFVFHPHGWSSPKQFVEFINYAVGKYGRKVKFLNFREAQERLDKQLLAGNPLRAAGGGDNGVRILDVNNDGFVDVQYPGRTRFWMPGERRWEECDGSNLTALQFGVMQSNGNATALNGNDVWHFQDRSWVSDEAMTRATRAVANAANGLTALRLRDLDRDGRCELILSREGTNSVFAWQDGEGRWRKLPYTLPHGTSLVDASGRDAGLRFVDINGDGYDDLLFSNGKEFSLHLFIPKANPRLMWEVGWNDHVWSGQRGASDLNIPMITRGGSNNGVWFKNGAMWVQNEDTAHLPDKVDKRTFRELLTADNPPPLAPAAALKSMRPRPGFKVELVAAEPLVLDPIAFDWGADGRLWVVDMFDYPLGPRGDGKPGGKIKVLEDVDGDGRYDRAAVFLDDVNFPTGVLPWRNGVIVAAAPEIFYAEDTDGDGRADKRTVLFTGFVEGNQQHRVNGFDYGLDNWIYGANGDSGGTIRSALHPERPAVSIRNRDFRFRPDTGEVEAVEGGTQYGRHRDDWGNWFGNNNPVWLWHYFLPERYLARNPQLTVKTTKRMLANYENSGRVFPASRTRQRFNDHHHFQHVTSACSPSPYRDDLFGPAYATSVFISDPVHNLVHREVLEADGVSFTSHRAADETNIEFLASTDLWFRPTMLKTGPDGALYVADMYRLVIEHPEWIPDWIEERMDLRAGSDRGRIYRVMPEGTTLRRIPNLAKLDTVGLAAALDSANGWQRDTAQRLLVERGDRTAIDAVRRLVFASAHPKVRLQALCTLDGLGGLTPTDAEAAMGDGHPAVREHAVRLAEPMLAGPNPPASLVATLLNLVQDSALRVRQQVAFALGAPGMDSARAGEALARLAQMDRAVPEMQTAILSSAPQHLGPLLQRVVGPGASGPVAPVLMEELLGLALARNQHRALAAALQAMADDASGRYADRARALAALLDGLERRGRTLPQFAGDLGPEARSTMPSLERLLQGARAMAGIDQAPEADRLAAIGLLARAPEQRGVDLDELGRLLDARNTRVLQQAALARLARQQDRAAADVLLATWTAQGPGLRMDVLTLLLSRTDWCRALLAAVQRGEVPAAQVGPTFQQKLLHHSDATVKKRAAELFGTVSSDRRALLGQYAGVPRLAGDATRGMALYRQQCAACHRLRGEGNEVGPDLGTAANKDTEALLVAILDPNQAVDWRYTAYTAVTRDEREISGVMVAETANGVTLRGPGGREETLLRSDLRDFRSSKLSLMPEGLEKAFDPQAMADLLAALRGK